jgi:hypothetical protein
VAAQNGDVAHHSEIEDASLPVSTSCGQELIAQTAENCGCNGILVAMEGREIS